jgi:hypothetical protein
MRYFFTEEDKLTDVRGAEIRAALVHAHHDVERGRIGEPAPPGVDVWMYGMGADGGPPLGDHIVRSLLDSRSKVVLFQLCDAPSMSFYRVPDALAERVQLFLRNHWHRDKAVIPEKYRARIGWLPPMLKRMAANPGRPLTARSGPREHGEWRKRTRDTRTHHARVDPSISGRDLSARGEAVPHVAGALGSANAREPARQVPVRFEGLPRAVG